MIGPTGFLAKSADESRASTSTLATDSELFFNAAADTYYLLNASLRGWADAASDYKYAIGGTATVTVCYGLWGGNYAQEATPVINGRSFVPFSGLGSARFSTGGAGATDNIYVNAWLLVKTVSAGTLGVQWAQNASTAVGAITRAGSWLAWEVIDASELELPPSEALSGAATLDFTAAAAATATAELSGVATLDFTADGAIAHLPHVAHIIKMADETRGPTTPVPITDDAELVIPLRPSTIYTVRISLIFIPAAGSIWRPTCTSPVDFASLFTHRSIATTATERWHTVSASDHIGDAVNTTRFNTPFNLVASAGGGRHMVGVIKTGPSGGTFSIQWGGGNTARTLKAGSFMYLREAEPY
jgi:hypothetical protein